MSRSWCPNCRAFLQGGDHFDGRHCGTCNTLTVEGTIDPPYAYPTGRLTQEEKDRIRKAAKPAGHWPYTPESYHKLFPTFREFWVQVSGRMKRPTPDIETHADPAVAIPDHQESKRGTEFLYEVLTLANARLARERLRKFNESQVCFDEPIGEL